MFSRIAVPRLDQRARQLFIESSAEVRHVAKSKFERRLEHNAAISNASSYLTHLLGHAKFATAAVEAFASAPPANDVVHTSGTNHISTTPAATTSSKGSGDGGFGAFSNMGDSSHQRKEPAPNTEFPVFDQYTIDRRARRKLRSMSARQRRRIKQHINEGPYLRNPSAMVMFLASQ